MPTTLPWAGLLIFVGFLLLYGGGEWVVAGAVRLAARLRVEPVVMGLTVVAFGTSLPEFLVSLVSALKGLDTVAVGAILGSNMFNMALVIGFSAIIANPLEGSRHVAQRDLPMLVVGMALFGILARDLGLSRFDGLILVVVFISYMVVTVRHPPRSCPDEVICAVGEVPGPGPWAFRLVGGLIMVSVGARLLVRGGVGLARLVGISERFIALTIVAWGTSLPEMATSLAAAFHGHAGLCVGNVVGSNIFNILFGIGFTAMVRPLALTAVALRVDYRIVAVTTLLLAGLMRGGRSIGRVGGLVLVATFGALILLAR